jgi:hypothetical protein
MQIYLVGENVDLGYHAVQGYTDGRDADYECERLTEIHNAKKISDLMEYCVYSQADAREYVKHYTPYEVVTVDVE